MNSNETTDARESHEESCENELSSHSIYDKSETFPFSNPGEQASASVNIEL